MEFKKQPKLTDIDDGIIEGENSENTEDLLNRNLGQNLKPKQNGISTSGVKDINPDSFLAVKSKHLITALPEEEFDEMYNEGSEKLRNMNKMSLAEAFEDDDIMDFIEEEDDISDNKKMSLLSSQLPGWGSWGGVGLKTRTSKIVKVDPYQKRKDKIIVNDYSNEKLKKHLVSSLPFPFTSVEAFESSIRNPIGRSFVPETVHNALVLPALITKMGQIIEPMTEEELNNKNEPLKFQKKGTGRKPFITKKIK